MTSVTNNELTTIVRIPFSDGKGGMTYKIQLNRDHNDDQIKAIETIFKNMVLERAHADMFNTTFVSVTARRQKVTLWDNKVEPYAKNQKNIHFRKGDAPQSIADVALAIFDITKKKPIPTADLTFLADRDDNDPDRVDYDAATFFSAPTNFDDLRNLAKDPDSNETLFQEFQRAYSHLCNAYQALHPTYDKDTIYEKAAIKLCDSLDVEIDFQDLENALIDNAHDIFPLSTIDLPDQK